MKVSIGSDHRGIEQRKIIGEAISKAGFEVDDVGTESTESCDYPNIASAVAKQILEGHSQLGVLVCGTGIGMSIAANKFKGIRAAIANDVEAAVLSRQHNNANVLCLAGDGFDKDGFGEIVTQWLNAEFEGGRHARRVDKITKIENGESLD